MLHLLRQGWRSSLTTRIVVVLLLIQAVLLPGLYVSIDRIAWRSNGELFNSIAQGYLVQHVQELESGRIALDASGLTSFLAGIVSSGIVAYAEVRSGSEVYRSHVDAPTAPPTPGVADVLEPGDDHIYYLSQRWTRGTVSGSLLLGFDESFMHLRVAGARRLLLASIAGFLILEILAGILLARYLTRPLRQLRRAARQIAAGELAGALETSTGIREVDELGRDLERMRASLDVMASRLHQRQRLETVGTLAGGVAHEFNNILLPIILFLETACDSLAEAHPARLAVERALGAAGRARDIVAKLLVFSRHGATASLERVSLARPVAEALNLFASVRPSTIEVQADLDPDADPVLVDPGQIIQVVMNLCTNAYQAIPSSGGTIRVAVRNVEGPAGREVELSIADSGSGMDAATLARVFEPFFTTREVGQGSGLGLAVVHGIVTGLHGTIHAESRPGAGTEFRLRWPSARTED